MALRLDSGHRSMYWPPMMIMTIVCASSGVITSSPLPKDPAHEHGAGKVRTRAGCSTTEARPWSAPVWDTRADLAPGPDGRKRVQRK